MHNYTIPFASGRSVALIRDARLKATESLPITRVVFVFPQAIDAIPIPDQKAALIHYLDSYGLRPEITGSTVRAQHGSEKLEAEFDRHNRFTKIDGTVHPKE